MCGDTGGVCSGTTCCDGACVDVLEDDANCGMCGRSCGAMGTCNNGGCECTAACPDSPLTGCCADGCKDLCTDNANCGACGMTCPGGGDCLLGGCDLLSIKPECISL